MMTIVLSLAVLTGFSVLAFWSRYAPFFMIVAGASMMAGLKFYDVYTNDTGLSISLCLIGYAFIAVAFAFRYIFWTGESRED